MSENEDLGIATRLNEKRLPVFIRKINSVNNQQPDSAQRVLTPEQVKRQLAQNGITTTEWAAKNGYSKNAVYRVLNGFDKALYGKSHEIAVKLGLKADPALACSDEASAPPAIRDLVIEDLKRMDVGIATTKAARKSLHDDQAEAYQHALNLVVYLRKSLFDRDGC